MVGLAKFYLGIVIDSLELVKSFKKEKKRVSVFDCDLVQTSIVNTES